MRTEHRQHLEQAGLHQVLPAEEGAFEARLHAARAWCGSRRGNRRKPGASAGASAAICRSIAGNVRRAVEFAARAKLNPILRIEPHHFDLAPQAGAGGSEDFIQHARVKEESRPEIELVAVRLDARGAPADEGQTFEDFYAHARGREQNGRSQSARASADDESLFSHGCEIRS